MLTKGFDQGCSKMHHHQPGQHMQCCVTESCSCQRVLLKRVAFNILCLHKQPYFLWYATSGGLCFTHTGADSTYLPLITDSRLWNNTPSWFAVALIHHTITVYSTYPKLKYNRPRYLITEQITTNIRLLFSGNARFSSNFICLLHCLAWLLCL